MLLGLLVASIYPATTFAVVEISDGSVKALYHLDGDSVDASGNGANGTDTGMTYPFTPKLGTKSARFNGNTYPSNGASITSAVSSVSTSFTFNFWIMASSTSSGDKGIISQGHWSTTGDFVIDNNNDNGASDDNKLGGGVYNDTPDTQSDSTKWTTGLVNTNSWNMVTVIRDVSSSKWRILINGVEDRNITLSSMNNLTGGAETYLGTFKVGTNYRGFNGYMDEVVIASSVFSTSTIASLYNSGIGDVVCTSPGCSGGATPSSSLGFMEGFVAGRMTVDKSWLLPAIMSLGVILLLVWTFRTKTL